MAVLFNNTIICENNGEDPTSIIQGILGTNIDYYLISNGKLIENIKSLPEGNIYVIPRLRGGKGGFGSMLRAIGAQIEKTTNREACRDLSGRRLRDINEEQRLKKWIEAKAEREKEALDRKKKKLKKLCEQPKFEFKDENYDKERELLTETVEDAVLQGMSKSSTSKQEKPLSKSKPNALKLWGDEDLSATDSSDDEDQEITDKGDEKGKKEENSQSKEEPPADETADGECGEGKSEDEGEKRQSEKADGGGDEDEDKDKKEKGKADGESKENNDEDEENKDEDDKEDEAKGDDSFKRKLEAGEESAEEPSPKKQKTIEDTN